MEEFKKWVEDIKIMVEKRVGKFAYIWMENTQSNVFSIGIALAFSGGQYFYMSFDQTEFNKNNKKQRRSLVKIRRQALAREIKDFGKTAIKTANALK